MSAPHDMPEKRGFDWQSAYRRIEAIQATLDAVDHPSRERTEQILHERAAKYAKSTEHAREDPPREVIVFDVDGERFAIDVRGGTAATSLVGLVPVPGLPHCYLGLLGHRGRVFPVIDIRSLAGSAGADRKSLRSAVLIGDGRSALGLAASEILGIEQYPSDRIATVADEPSRHHALVGIGPGSSSIFDTARLLQDNRLVVDDQPSITVQNEGDGS